MTNALEGVDIAKLSYMFCTTSHCHFAGNPLLLEDYHMQDNNMRRVLMVSIKLRYEQVM